MKKYDVLIIGAGPAGGQCARELSKNGFKVLLVDKAKDFLENNYSSGGAPLEIMSRFDLPNSVVGTYWNNLRIYSTKEKAIWTSPSSFGPVLDFDKLRSFLVDETVKNKSECFLRTQYQTHRLCSDSIEIDLKDLNNSSIYTVQSSVLVDATGSERKVLAQDQINKNREVIATGIEYHIKVDEDIYQSYANSLNFFLGHHWMPQGYAWIFPMSSHSLKIGVIRYFQNKSYVPYEPSYKHYLEQLLHLCGNYEIIDKHGKTIHYTQGQKDLQCRGPVIAIGDAISSINPLGWEGIRHAMFTGDFAAQTIQSYLRKETSSLNNYKSYLNQYFGYKWFFSEKFMNHLFKTKNDSTIDRSVASFARMTNEEIMKVIFQYQFRYTFKSYFWYFLSQLK